MISITVTTVTNEMLGIGYRSLHSGGNLHGWKIHMGDEYSYYYDCDYDCDS